MITTPLPLSCLKMRIFLLLDKLLGYYCFHVFMAGVSDFSFEKKKSIVRNLGNVS